MSGLIRFFPALLVFAVISACSSEPAEIQPPVCARSEIRDNGKRAPDLSTVVPCTTAHRYEVFDVIDLPRGALTGSDEAAQERNRDDLALPSELGDDSPQREVFEKFAEERCATSLQRVTGYDSMTVNGRSAEKVRLIPALRGVLAPWYSVMPESQWLAGRRQVVCSARMARPVRAAAGDDAEGRQVLLLSLAREAGFPAELRQCRGYDKDRRRVGLVPCTRRHVSEMLFFFEADRAMGKKFVARIVKAPTAARFDRLDRVCTRALPQLLGKKHDKELRGFASIERRWTKKIKTVRCDVGPVEFETHDLPPGSLVGTTNVDVRLRGVS